MGMTREKAIKEYVIPALMHTWNEKINKEVLEALEQEPTTKNNLGVDCISRARTQTEIEMNASRYTIAKERGGMGQVEWSDQLIKVSDAVDIIRNLPSVTPQEPIFDELRAEITTLQNRCYALTKGTMCAFCKYECDYKEESEDKE